MENRTKHLEMIQSVISRMGHDSFYVKSWSVLLVSAFLVLCARDNRASFVLFACFPAVAFWILDGYFLWQERLYRRLYDQVRNLREEDIDFSMNTSVVIGQVSPWLAATFSKTLFVFHGMVVATIVAVVTMILTRS